MPGLSISTFRSKASRRTTSGVRTSTRLKPNNVFSQAHRYLLAAHNLLNLCLRSPHERPACFYFSSSVSTRQGKWSQVASEEITDDPANAASTGYGRSKWITEKICQLAAEKRGSSLRRSKDWSDGRRYRQVSCFRSGLTCCMVTELIRLTNSGVWNTTEAIPLMFKTAQTIKALPKLDDVSSKHQICRRNISESSCLSAVSILPTG